MLKKSIKTSFCTPDYLWDALKLSNGILLQEFSDIKRKYTILQEKLKTQGPPKVTLEKVKQLKEEAEKLAEETEKKIKRITGDVLTSTVSGKYCVIVMNSRLKALPTDTNILGSPEIKFKTIYLVKKPAWSY